MSKRGILSKVASLIEKKQSSQSLGMSFTIILETPTCSISDPTHPDYSAPTFEQTHIRTKGYQPNEHTEHTEHTSNQQTSEVQEND